MRRSLRSAIHHLFLYGLLTATPAAAAAQSRQDLPRATSSTEAPAHIAVVEGAAAVVREGVEQPAIVNAPFLPGDGLRTLAGRVELLFADGSALDVDEYSAIELRSAARVRLSHGRILLVVAENREATPIRYEIEGSAASVRVDEPGEYRVTLPTADAGELSVAVLSGSASIENDRGAAPLRAGEQTTARDGEAPAPPVGFRSRHYDDFDLWTMGERDARAASPSAEYLPEDLQVYASSLDRDGSWEYMQPYGYVWYPTVSLEWRPYYRGHWQKYRRLGWTWIGLDSWAWPTHHYGRWNRLGDRWYWIPGRSWAPAWVAWATAPEYVSWCPLGVDGRAAAHAPGFAQRSAWTIVPRTAFGGGDRVDRFAVAPQTLPPSAAFVARRAAPVEIPARTPHVVAAPASATRAIARSPAATRIAGSGSSRTDGGVSRTSPSVGSGFSRSDAGPTSPQPPRYAMPRPAPITPAPIARPSTAVAAPQPPQAPRATAPPQQPATTRPIAVPRPAPAETRPAPPASPAPAAPATRGVAVPRVAPSGAQPAGSAQAAGGRGSAKPR